MCCHKGKFSIDMKTIDSTHLQRIWGVVMGAVLGGCTIVCCWPCSPCVIATKRIAIGQGQWDDYVRRVGLRVDRGKNR